jgi:hypothetical protein
MSGSSTAFSVIYKERGNSRTRVDGRPPMSTNSHPLRPRSLVNDKHRRRPNRQNRQPRPEPSHPRRPTTCRGCSSSQLAAAEAPAAIAAAAAVSSPAYVNRECITPSYCSRASTVPYARRARRVRIKGAEHLGTVERGGRGWWCRGDGPRHGLEVLLSEPRPRNSRNAIVNQRVGPRPIPAAELTRKSLVPVAVSRNLYTPARTSSAAVGTNTSRSTSSAEKLTFRSFRSAMSASRRSGPWSVSRHARHAPRMKRCRAAAARRATCRRPGASPAARRG